MWKLQSYISLASGNVQEATKMYHECIAACDAHQDTWAIIRLCQDYADLHIEDFVNKPLAASPIIIKDNIFTAGYITSCGSAMLQDYVPAYNASCFSRLEDAGGLMIAKANMDEFAMWSSNESSYFGPVRNIYGIDRVPGWSSGGSAVAVAAGMCLAALWTDTGWSVRQPAALCNVVWVKPTYGRVSRYGVQAMASSLDQVWVITQDVDDAVILLDAISGYDTHDAQSDARADIKDDWKDWSYDASTLRVCVPREFMSDGLDPLIKQRLETCIAWLRAQWVVVDEVSVPLLSYVVPIYYTLMPAEVSTNLARFDGIRFGVQEAMKDIESLPDYYTHVRSTWFGEEVKRRILLWTYVLSSAHYEWLYLKAQQARDALCKDFATLFAQYDIILSPTSPEFAWKLWQKTNDPLAMYLADLYTISANLCGLPAISIPAWFGDVWDEKLPIGLHLMAGEWQEGKMFAMARVIEKLFQ